MSKAYIYELDKNDYGTIFKDFQLDQCRLELKSLLLHQTPGVIYVDSKEKPETAFIWNEEHNFLILGNENNKEFNKLLSETIYRSIFKKAKAKEDILDFYVRPSDSNSGWLDRYKEMITDLFKDNPTMIHKRRHYLYELSEYEIRKRKETVLNDNIKVEFVDKNFLKKTHLENIDEIITWIKNTWASEELFIEKGFGFCLIINNVIASWCIADYCIDMECEIGIETDERYREKGYATFMVTETLNYCKANGFNKVNWHCVADNVGSYKLAEKIGFKRMEDYATYHAWFNVFDNFLVNGHYCLVETKEYQKAAEFYEKAFDMKKNNGRKYQDSAIFSQTNNIKWCHYNAACAWALTNEYEHAFSNLQEAVKAGWNDIDMMNNDIRLDALKVSGKWEDLIKTLG